MTDSLRFPIQTYFDLEINTLNYSTLEKAYQAQANMEQQSCLSLFAKSQLP